MGYLLRLTGEQTSIGVLQAPGTSVSNQLSHIWMNGCEAVIKSGEAG
jgi:hypothetical protein